MRPLNRPTPILPSQAMVTYEIAAPRTSDFWRLATCEEMDCPNFLNGWAVAITPDLMGEGFDDSIKASGKSYQICTVGEAEARFPGMSFAGAIKVFVFAPGQPCFYQGTQRHITRIDRPEIFTRAAGDYRWRGQVYKHTRAADWVDDFGEHQDRLAEAIKKG